MKTPQVPAPPDPVATANAQAKSNVQTATTQQQLNMVNQTNPYGSTSYKQIGAWQDGTPRFELTETLSPENQKLFDESMALAGKYGATGNKLMDAVSSSYSQPFKLGNEATEARLMELGRARLDPMMAERRAALETKLYNQGAMPGTEAWDRAMGDLGEQENDAYNQLLLSGRAQAGNELLTERNQPLTEMNAFLTGSQPQQRNFQDTPNTSVAGTDIAGLTMDAYKLGPLAQWQAEQQARNAMMGGIFGLGSAALGGWGRSGFTMPKFG